MNTESRIMARRAAKGGAILLALIGVGIWVATLAGCGSGSGGHGSVAAADAGTASSEHPSGTTPAPVATAAQPQAQGATSYAADSLPPDVMITSSDLEGVRGQQLEINARGSDDVVEVVLKDGFGKPQAFTYDASLKEWRVIYRVPLKTAGERLALSITAKNGAGRYCRVWLFPQVTDGQKTAAEPQATPAEPDSGKEK